MTKEHNPNIFVLRRVFHSASRAITVCSELTLRHSLIIHLMQISTLVPALTLVSEPMAANHILGTLFLLQTLPSPPKYQLPYFEPLPHALQHHRNQNQCHPSFRQNLCKTRTSWKTFGKYIVPILGFKLKFHTQASNLRESNQSSPTHSLECSIHDSNVQSTMPGMI